MMIQIVGTTNRWERYCRTVIMESSFVSIPEPRTLAMGARQKDSVGVRKNQGKTKYSTEKRLVSNLP